MNRSVDLDDRGRLLLQKGIRLKACCDLQVFIPPDILEPPGTPFSELVLLSNEDSDVGLMESSKQEGKVAAICLFMNKGDEIELGKSCEIFVKSSDQHQHPFVELDK